MGKLIYDNETAVNVEDRTLAHLQVVIGTKLRRHEAFYFTWKQSPPGADGFSRSTIWIHPTIPLRFNYLGSVDIVLNREWLENLTVLANSANGLSAALEPSVP